ncbi:MAG: polyprenyl diphosphate synthase, partial [Nitrososphaera sp.]
MGLQTNIDRGGKALMETFLQLSGIYSIYERRLESEIVKSPLPNHVAIVLDGNRRWAKFNLLDIGTGHTHGADKAEEMLNWIHDIGIKITTLYVLSTENLERKDRELEKIYELLEIKLQRLYDDERVHKRQMKIKAIGDTKLLPPSLQEILTKLEESTSEYNNMFLNIAIAYGGQKELIEAIRKIAQMAKQGQIDVEEIDEKTIESCLYT